MCVFVVCCGGLFVVCVGYCVWVLCVVLVDD